MTEFNNLNEFYWKSVGSLKVPDKARSVVLNYVFNSYSYCMVMYQFLESLGVYELDEE